MAKSSPTQATPAAPWHPGSVDPRPKRPSEYQRRERPHGERKKAILYLRVSQTAGRVGRDDYHSEELQLKDTRRCAEQNGYEVVDTVVHRDQTGGELDRLHPIIERIEAGEADSVVVYKTARFARRARAQYEIISRLLECGGDLLVAHEPFDLYSQHGRWMVSMLLQQAEAELETSKDYWWEIQAENIARGISNSKAPFGYRKKNLNPTTGKRTGPLEPDPKNDRAKYARKIFQKRAQGWPYSKLVSWLEDHGQRTLSGARFSATTIRRMISSRTYRGEISYGPWMRNDNAHEALVSEAEWQAAQSSNPPRPARAKETENQTLLAGLIRCAYCRYTMAAGGLAGGPRMYRCVAAPSGYSGHVCPHPPAIAASKIEDYVESEVIKWARDQNIKALRMEADDSVVTELLAEVEKWEHRLEVWTSDPANLDDAAHFRRQRDALKEGRNNAREALRAHRLQVRSFEVEDDTLDRWERKGLDVETRRRLLSTVVGAVFILKTKGGKTGPRQSAADRALIVSTDDLPRLPKAGHPNPEFGPVPGITLLDGSIAPPDPIDLDTSSDLDAAGLSADGR